MRHERVVYGMTERGDTLQRARSGSLLAAIFLLLAGPLVASAGALDQRHALAEQPAE